MKHNLQMLNKFIIIIIVSYCIPNTNHTPAVAPKQQRVVVTSSERTITTHTKSLIKVESLPMTKTFAFEFDKIEHLKKPVGDVVTVLRSNLFHREVGGDMREELPTLIIP